MLQKGERNLKVDEGEFKTTSQIKIDDLKVSQRRQQLFASKSITLLRLISILVANLIDVALINSFPCSCSPGYGFRGQYIQSWIMTFAQNRNGYGSSKSYFPNYSSIIINNMVKQADTELHEIEYANLFTKLTTHFPHFPTRIRITVFYIFIQSSYFTYSKGLSLGFKNNEGKKEVLQIVAIWLGFVPKKPVF